MVQTPQERWRDVRGHQLRSDDDDSEEEAFGSIGDSETDMDEYVWPDDEDEIVSLHTKLAAGIDEKSLSPIPCEQLSKDHLLGDKSGRLPAILLDSLARYQKWDKVIGSAEGVPSAKAILDNLLLVLPPKYRLRLVMKAHRLYTIPLVLQDPMTGKMAHRHQDSHLRYIGLHKPTLLSVSLDAEGNSTLLNLLFRCVFQIASDDERIHPGSAELFVARSEGFHVIDIHGKYSTSQIVKETCRNVMESVQYYLIHTTSNPETLTHSLMPILRSIVEESRSYCKMKKRILVLLRDCSSTDEAHKLAEKLQKKLLRMIEWQDPNSELTLAVRGIVQLDKLNDTKKLQALNPIYNHLREHLIGAASHSNFWELCSRSSAAADLALTAADGGESEGQDREGRSVHQTVKAALASVSDWQAALCWSKRTLATCPATTDSGEPAALLDEIHGRRDMGIHPVAKHFLNTVSQDPDNLWEWQEQLADAMDAEKPKFKELEQQRNRLLADLQLKREALESCTGSGLADPEAAQKLRASVEKAKAELVKVTSDISSVSVTPEKLWRELIEVHDSLQLLSPDARARLSIADEDVPKAFAQALERGHPVEVLDGDSLACHKEFINAVLRQVADTSSTKSVRTVAIIGPQSSGKSTLANALWGADFATSAGRCTKGLDASLFHTDMPGLENLLYLDPEGLCSVERDQEYDQKLVLLVLALSDVVLVNMKGEMNATMQKILQMAVYCLQSMSILPDLGRPELIFVQRDMVDFTPAKYQETMRLVQALLHEATKMLKRPDGSPLPLEDVLRVGQDSLFLMPSAFIPMQTMLKEQREEMTPNPEFGEAVFKLRDIIMTKTTAHVAAAKDLQDWSRRFGAVKTTIDHFGHLGSFRDIQEVMMRQSLDRLVSELLERHVQSERMEDSLEARFEAMEKPLEDELVSNLKNRSVRVRRCELIDETRRAHTAKAERIKDLCSEQLLQAFDEGCEQLGVSRDSAEDTRRQLKGRVNLAADHRCNTFRSRMNSYRSEGCVDEAVQCLKQELGKQRASQEGPIEESAAQRIFERHWSQVREQLKKTLKSQGLDYKQAISDMFVALLKRFQVEALSSLRILSEEPLQGCRLDTELAESVWTIPEHLRGRAEMQHQKRCETWGFVLHNTHILEVPKRGFGRGCALNDLAVGDEIRPGSTSDEVVLVRHSRVAEHFQSLIQLQSGRRQARASLHPLDDLVGTWVNDDCTFVVSPLGESAVEYCQTLPSGVAIRGRLFWDRRSASTRVEGKVRRGPTGKLEFSVSLQLNRNGNIESTFTTPERPYTKVSQRASIDQQKGLENVCNFLDIDVADAPGPEEASVYDSVCSIFFTPKKARQWQRAQEVQRKAAVVLKLVALLQKTVDAAASDIDDTLANFDRRAKQLLQELDIFGTTRPDVTSCLWSLRAETKNECLRLLREQLTTRLVKEQKLRMDGYLASFDIGRAKIEDVFVKLCTCIYDEKVKAEAFLQEALQHKIRELQKAEERALKHSLESLFKNPEDFMKKCDEVFILNHRDQEKEDVLRHFISQEESYRSWAQQQLRQTLEQERGCANKQVQVKFDSYLKDWRGAMHDLCSALTGAGGVSLKRPMGSPDELETSESVGSSAFKALQAFLSTGVASFTLNDDKLEVRTSHVVELPPPEILITQSMEEPDTFINELVHLLDTKFDHDYVCGQCLDESLMEEVIREVADNCVGCSARCPYCRRKCTMPRHDPWEVQHCCSCHQPHGFGGVRVIGTKKPAFLLCDSFENRHYQFAYTKEDQTSFLPFDDHLREAHPEWQILAVEESHYFLWLRKSFEEIWERIGEDLCRHHKMNHCSYAEGLQALKESAEPRPLQLGILMDTTGSMAGFIRQCQKDLVQLVENIKTGLKKFGMNPEVEVAFVGYKDIYPGGGQDKGHLDGINFNKDVERVKAVIMNQIASGGGDGPEDIAGAFQKVLSFSWRPEALKAIVVVADAPCHGTDYSSGSDSFPNDSEKMDKALKLTFDRGVNLLFSSISSYTQKMEKRFEEHFQNFSEEDADEKPVSVPRFRSFNLRDDGVDGLLQNLPSAVVALAESMET